MWALLSLADTEWRDEEFKIACSNLMEAGIKDEQSALAIVMAASLEDPELINTLEQVGENFRPMLMAENPRWLEVILDSATRSPKIAAMIQPYLPKLAERLDEPYWSANLEASRCKLAINELAKVS